VDPVPDPLLLRKSVSAGNLTRNLWVSGEELWPQDHRGGLNAGMGSNINLDNMYTSDRLCCRVSIIPGYRTGGSIGSGMGSTQPREDN
jgi:hypothetical protein